MRAHRAIHVAATTMHAMRVLVVEDEPKLAGLLARGLGEEGHPTDVAASGDEAVWMARASPYDAIVLDVMLPGRTGSRSAASSAPRRVDARPLPHGA